MVRVPVITIEIQSSKVNVKKYFRGKSAESRSTTYLRRIKKVLDKHPNDKSIININHWNNV